MNAITSAFTRFARVAHAGSTHFVRIQPGGPTEVLDAAPWHDGKPVGVLPVSLDSPAVSFLCPTQPTKILGIGRNYADHARELGNTLPTSPLVFLKPPSSLLGPGGVVELPPESERVDFEGELGVVIAKRGRRVALNEAASMIFGLAVTCDVTARDLQQKDGQWARAKGFDTFCPVGPFITQGPSPDALSLKLTQDGAIRQNGNTKDMVFGVLQLISHISQSMTLEPGDLILTGTPAGVGPLSDGNVVTVSIEHCGELTFTVAGHRSGSGAAP